MGKIQLKVKRLDGEDTPMPSYAKPGDAGLDLRAAIDDNILDIDPGRTALVGTGTAVEIPEGHFGMVVPRSGIARHRSLAPINSPGIIDSGYRGEVMVPLHNYNQHIAFGVIKGERIAQLVVVPYAECDVVEADELTDSERGDGGFGSSGRM